VTPEASIRFRFRRLASTLDERALRLFAATEAEAIGFGGISRVSRITGLARTTITRGQQELRRRATLSPGKIRRPGGGRKKVSAIDPAMVEELERLVEPLSRGDPMSPIRWTCKSIRTLADGVLSILVDEGIPIRISPYAAASSCRTPSRKRRPA
jgi:hypothetical protein